MNILNRYIEKYAFYIFIVVTLIIAFIRTPFWDETHAFQIASLSLKEIFYLTRVEGHPILWYLILKPFTGLNLYPYSMIIINWVFCVLSIYILFKKSPFPPIYKLLITFSTPFLLYYAPVARCYSIGIFFIFLICAYHPLRFKRPYLYSVLIVLASQTSVLAMISVFYTGLIFLFELIKKSIKNLISKKILFNVLLIFILAGVLILFEFIHPQVRKIIFPYSTLIKIIKFVIYPEGVNLVSYILRLTSAILFYTLPFFLFKYSKKGLFYIVSSYVTLSCLFMFLFRGSYWNYYFYYICLIVLFWMYARKLLKKRFIKYTLLLFFTFMTLPYAVQNGTVLEYIYSSSAKDIANYISKNKEYHHKKLYVLEWWSEISPGADLYLKKKGITLYNKNNIKRGSFEDLKNIFKLKRDLIDLDEFVLNAPKDYYILSDGNLLNMKFKNCKVTYLEGKNLIFETSKNKYLFKVVDNKMSDLKFIVYKVVKL